jgi:hypothetical protein
MQPLYPCLGMGDAATFSAIWNTYHEHMAIQPPPSPDHEDDIGGRDIIRLTPKQFRLVSRYSSILQHMLHVRITFCNHMISTFTYNTSRAPSPSCGLMDWDPKTLTFHSWQARNAFVDRAKAYRTTYRNNHIYEGKAQDPASSKYTTSTHTPFRDYFLCNAMTS